MVDLLKKNPQGYSSKLFICINFVIIINNAASLLSYIIISYPLCIYINQSLAGKFRNKLIFIL